MEEKKSKPVEIGTAPMGASPAAVPIPDIKELGSIRLQMGDLSVQIDGRPAPAVVDVAWTLIGSLHDKWVQFYGKSAPRGKENEIG